MADILREKFEGRLDVRILDTAFMEHMGFSGRGPTHVFLDRKKVLLKTAMDDEKMEQFIKDEIG